MNKPCETEFDTVEGAQAAADTLDYVGFKNWLGVFQKPDGVYVFDAGWEHPRMHKSAMLGKWTLVSQRWPHQGATWQTTDEPFDPLYQLWTGLGEANDGD